MTDVAEDENESEIVRLELLEMSRSAIHQYATKFKSDGVSKEELTNLFKRIESIVDDVLVPEDDKNDIRTIKKNNIVSKMKDTEDAIETAYGTSKES